MNKQEAKLKIEDFIRFINDDPNGHYGGELDVWETIQEALAKAMAKYPHKSESIQLFWDTYDGIGNGNLRELMEKEPCIERMITDLVRLKHELEKE